MSELPEPSEDPTNELQRLWQQLEAPAPDGPGDEATQASVAWAQAAWKTITPAPRAPKLRLRPRRQLRPLLLMPVAAAAAALLIWIGLDRRATKPTQPSQTSLTASAPMRAHPISDGSLELRRGRVRLILIDNQATEDL
ncbi:MAG: ferric-dicitrate binding protein FerR (iron transport regulator) [Planctomycetota bacterium]|jgi:ferric-dicitrate binding protein FerR (iron transport regulator)